MGAIYLFTERGTRGGIWYGAQYPLGATRYYASELARTVAVDCYARAIRATGGQCWTVNASDVTGRPDFTGSEDES